MKRSHLAGLSYLERQAFGRSVGRVEISNEIKRVAVDAILTYQGEGIAGEIGKIVGRVLQENRDAMAQVEEVRRRIDDAMRDRRPS